MGKSQVIWVGYTFKYREGGPKIKRVAETMVEEFRQARSECEILLCELNSKREFVDAMSTIPMGSLVELHFVGHSGMYGPMFGTTQLPEQFSPHEWRELNLPFAPEAKAYFHACRTGRWFTHFFAKTFSIPTYGYHWYTTFSTDPSIFRWEGWRTAQNGKLPPLYMRGCPGKKSHGPWAGVKKYLGKVELEQPQRSDPPTEQIDASYDPVAAQYAGVFEKITVRRDEWRWIKEHFDELSKERDEPLTMLDIGCGNGALLRELAPRLKQGEGVDASRQLLQHAKLQSTDYPHLRFQAVESPALPFADGQFDVVTSFLSFRYLDWDPLMLEIVRVLKPGGRIFIIDMVTAPLKFREFPQLLRSKITYAQVKRDHPVFYERLQTLVNDPAWADMLRYNPIRSEHEMTWYLESRFQERKVEVINVGWHNRVLAFDSGPIWDDYIAPQSYP